MVIKLVSLEDYDRIYALWNSTEGVGLNSIDDSYEGFHKYLLRNPSTSFAAFENGDILGVIMCGHDGRRGFIYHTAVVEQHRGKGIGNLLVSAALEALIKEGITKVALVVFSTNEAGNRFWEKLGFSQRDDLVYRNLSLNPHVK